MSNFTFFYKNTGDFIVCGSNEYGQLGTGDYDNRKTPTIAFNNKNITIISSGHAQVIFMD